MLDYYNLGADELRDVAKGITSGIFRQVVVDLGYSHSDIKRMFFEHKITEQEMFEMQENIDKVYCEKVVKLSTHCLELIIYAHKERIMGRAQRTIDAITTELLERELHEKEGKD